MLKRIMAVIAALCLTVTCACADDIVFSVSADAWQSAVSETVKSMTGEEAIFTIDENTVTASANSMSGLTAMLDEDGRLTGIRTSAEVSLAAMAADSTPIGIAIVLNVMSMAKAEGKALDLNDTVNVLSALTDAVRAAEVDEYGVLETALACEGHRLHISVQTRNISQDDGFMLWTVTYYP